ncbi:hypothetical protein CRG98_044761 [Punica granatum]|uniref:Uncharacterized protein n=1 Tax=Punica granatum TaxID=22663 RepID=A0A2I0HT25_PUNGR|nr:hypothetical protein CRG98_044761 [Punica granatum]
MLALSAATAPETFSDGGGWRQGHHTVERVWEPFYENLMLTLMVEASSVATTPDMRSLSPPQVTIDLILEGGDHWRGYHS